jgi:hypothetical protein
MREYLDLANNPLFVKYVRSRLRRAKCSTSSTSNAARSPCSCTLRPMIASRLSNSSVDGRRSFLLVATTDALPDDELLMVFRRCS